MLACCRLFSAGILFLTTTYIGMVLLLHFYAPTKCLDTTKEPTTCSSEGVDNTILNWASDFFVSTICFLLSFHLSYFGTAAVRKSSILVQIFMGGSFILRGVGSWMYPNSGVDDNIGMLLGYWIVMMGAAVFFTMSALSMAQFALMASRNLNPIRDNLCCARNSIEHKRSCFPSKWTVAVCEILLTLALVAFLTGGVWCSTEKELQVNTVVDDASPTSDVHVCFTILWYSNFGIHMSYALLWLPVGFLLKSACVQWPCTILGLPTSLATTLAMVLQWTVGSMFPVYLWWVVLIRNDNDYNEPTAFLELWQQSYGTVLYHWGMLLTLYCFHNISFGLPEGCRHPGDDQGPPVMSMEWFLCKLGFGPKNDPEHCVEKSEKSKSSSRSIKSEKIEDNDKKSKCDDDGKQKSASKSIAPSDEDEEEEIEDVEIAM